MRGVGIHTYWFQIKAGGGHIAALGEKGALNFPGQLHLPEGGCVDADDVGNTRLNTPGADIGIDVCGQAVVTKLVELATRPEKLAEILQRYLPIAVQ